jgi:hypothetical protein
MSPAAVIALMSGQAENFIAAATPGGIEAQEKRGQIEQSFLDTLPKKGFDRPTMESLGFTFNGDHDDLFFSVTFPKGWRKRATEHAMWSDLLDDKGRKRGSIFYKAAFYDRSAHMHLVPRYTINGYRDAGAGKDETAVMDGETVIYSAGIRDERDYETSDKHRKQADDWLKANFPNHNNPLAYWD